MKVVVLSLNDSEATAATVKLGQKVAILTTISDTVITVFGPESAFIEPVDLRFVSSRDAATLRAHESNSTCSSAAGCVANLTISGLATLCIHSKLL